MARMRNALLGAEAACYFRDNAHVLIRVRGIGSEARALWRSHAYGARCRGWQADLLRGINWGSSCYSDRSIGGDAGCTWVETLQRRDNSQQADMAYHLSLAVDRTGISAGGAYNASS